MPHPTDTSEEWFDEEANHAEDLEFARLQQTVWKEGYKQGISDAKDAGLQKGFEEGFTECANLCAKLGELKGNLRALLQFPAANAPHDTAAIDKLLNEIDDYSVNAGKINFPNQPKSAADFAELSKVNQANVTDVVSIFLKRGAALLEPKTAT